MMLWTEAAGVSLAAIIVPGLLAWLAGFSISSAALLGPAFFLGICAVFGLLAMIADGIGRFAEALLARRPRPAGGSAMAEGNGPVSGVALCLTLVAGWCGVSWYLAHLNGYSPIWGIPLVSVAAVSCVLVVVVSGLALSRYVEPACKGVSAILGRRRAGG